MTSVFYVKKTLRFTVSIIYFHLTLVLSKYQNNKYQYIKKTNNNEYQYVFDT